MSQETKAVVFRFLLIFVIGLNAPLIQLFVTGEGFDGAKPQPPALEAILRTLSFAPA
jgi:hypothetical protein